MEKADIKNKENKKFYILGIITFIVLTIIIIQNLMIFSIEQLKNPVGKKAETTLGQATVVKEEITEIGTCPGSGREVPKSDMLMPPGGSQWYDVTAGGQPGTFCTGNGTQFYRESGAGATTYLKDLKAIVQAGAIKGSYSTVKSRTSYKPYSFPQLYCKQHDVELSEVAPDIAYAVSSGASNEEIQEAVWGMGTNREVSTPQGPLELGSDIPFESMDLTLTEQSGDYADFKDIKDSYQADQDVNLNLSVNTDEALVQVDYDKQILIIGPIYIDYPAGGIFGGISDMYFEGFNSLGNTVKGQERIEINNFGSDVNKIDQELNFFNGNNNKGLIDTSDNKAYPNPGQGFYVTINNPNLGVSASFSTSETITMQEHLKISTVTKIKLHYKYQWMEVTSVKGCYLGAYVEQLTWSNPTKTGNLICGHHNSNCYDEDDELTCGHYHTQNCDEWTATPSLTRKEVQSHMVITKVIRTLFEQEVIQEVEIPIEIDISININVNINIEGAADNTMMIGGKVWEDTLQGKDQKANGIKDENDKVLPNVKVTLYEVEKGKETEKPGKVANLILSEVGTTKENVMNTINPTYTNKDGEYLFIGVDPLKKYYVEFEYNGQTYLPTEYEKNVSVYNSEAWEVTSKGTETPSERNAYNLRFHEICSSPENYPSTNSLGWLAPENRGYNQAFSQYDLMGFELDADGNYKQGTRLIDSYYSIDANGNVVETSEFQEGEISKAIKKYIENNLKTPDKEAMKAIYESIAGNNQELRKMIQFVEDTKIYSYTQSQGAANYDLYPVYNQFTLNVKSKPLPAGFYPGIYGGQLYINQGLVKRKQTDLSLKKDVAYAATRINEKTEVYKYDKRPGEDSHWEIQVRMRDYENYYGMFYNRENYPTDYYYKQEDTNLNGRNLELYVTYKITIRNSSQSILNQVTEVVDYYDKEYTYMPNLSWVMYKDNNNEDYTKVAVSQNAYQRMIHNLNLSELGQWARPISKDRDNTYYATTQINGTYNGNSIYSKLTQQDVEEQYNSVYINGLKDKKLASGESAYIYLTFKVNEDENGRIILDNDNNSAKMNYAEINGYKTYYADGTELPNNVKISGVNTPAGLIDVNSTPGNLCNNDLQGEKYEKNFEDDTDRAPGLKIIIDNSAIRGLNGTTWEDQRTQTVNNAIIGNGLKQNGEIGVNGVTVQLVEQLEGKEYIWQETLSGSGTGKKYNFETGKVETYSYDKKDGYYEFSEFIPGNYIVRFKYGHNNETVLTAPSGGQNAVSYNGQDFKSTVYEQDLTKNQGLPITDNYNIKEVDKLSQNGQNLSDAKDLWESKTIVTGSFLQAPNTNYQNLTYQGRTTVNSYSNNKVQNHIAEILGAPYTDSNQEMIQELISNTNMVAETATIIVEGEYNRTSTEGSKTESNGANDYLYGNDHNGSYTINFVDFGLTERPKAQLEIGKTVTNVKINLANGNTLFDASKSTNSMIWVSGEPYNLSSKMSNKKYNEYYNESKTNNNMNRYSYRTEVNKLISGLYKGSEANGLIQATMDAELMHGATIQISYLLTVTNVGETDYEGQNFYYKGTNANTIVTTTPNLVLDYVSNNLQYRDGDNSGWTTTTSKNLLNSGLVNKKLEKKIEQFNNFIQTTSMAKALKPGESVTKDLYLTQLITSQNTNDDKTYENITELVQTSNTVGRRMAYSIVGNQDPTVAPSEVDAARSERVTILPPFGSGNIIAYITLAVGGLTILIGGVIFIKKKVL